MPIKLLLPFPDAYIVVYISCCLKKEPLYLKKVFWETLLENQAKTERT